MANQKLTELTELTSPSTDDILYIVDAPSGAALQRKITVANLLAPDFVVETAQAGLPSEVVLGTTVITTAAYASRQAAAKAGRLFLPNDGFALERDTGSAWAPFGPCFPFTAPVSADFSWANQGGATVSTANGGIHLSDPANASLGWRLRSKAAPATPYTITAAFLPKFALVSAGEYPSAGIGFRQSSDGKLVMVNLLLDGAVGEIPYVAVDKLNSPTSLNTNMILAYGMVCSLGAVIWFKIEDDGTSRAIYIGNDGQNWSVISSEGRTVFMTADEVCFGVSSRSAIFPAGMTLIHWKQGTT